jgi:hypothetical protein
VAPVGRVRSELRAGQWVDRTARRGCRARSEATEVDWLTGRPEGRSAAHVFAADFVVRAPRCESDACFASLAPPKRRRAGYVATEVAGSVRETLQARFRSVAAAEAEARSPGPGSGGRLPSSSTLGKPCDEGRGRRAAGIPTTPSLGFVSLSATSTRAIVASVCLTDTVRPQGFSPSRRFDPARALWVCFAPLPPIGFGPSELFPRGQPRCLSASVAPLPLS